LGRNMSGSNAVVFARLSAIMLGRLRSSVEAVLAEYETLGNRVFAKPRKMHFKSAFFWARSKYNHRILEEVLKDIIDRALPPSSPESAAGCFAQPEREQCRRCVPEAGAIVAGIVLTSIHISFVVSVEQREEANEPYLFRTFDHFLCERDAEDDGLPFLRNPGPACNDPIWKIARATTAAPTYFSSMKINGEPQTCFSLATT
jgi:hypothetical protein